MFIDDIYAEVQSGTSAEGAVSKSSGFEGLISNLVPIGLVLLIFYFLVIRPNDKRRAEQKRLLDDLKLGEKVVTGSGIVGLVKKFEDEYVVLETVEGSGMITVLKDTIVKIISRQQVKNDEKNSKTLNIVKSKKNK